MDRAGPWHLQKHRHRHRQAAQGERLGCHPAPYRNRPPNAALKDPKIARWMAATLRKNATRDVDQKELVGLLEELDQAAAKADQT